MRESDLQLLIRLALARDGSTVFRNNVGTAWVGDVARLESGSILIKNPRPLHAGLTAGSSDLIGWTSVEVSAEMIGRRIAVFTAVECKTPGGRVTPQQENFLAQLRLAGGIGFIARSVNEATGGIADWRMRRP